jgi:hypothetical protein
MTPEDTMRKTILDLTLATTLALACLVPASPVFAQAAPVIEPGSKALQDTGNFKVKERTIYLPTAQVHWMAYNRLKAVQHAGVLSRATRSSYSSTEVSSPVDMDKLQPIAQQLHDDLVQKLEAAGWNVETAQEMGGALAGLKPYGTDAGSGLPLATWAEGKYAVATPAGMATADTQAPSTGMAQARFIKGKGGAVLIPIYRFDTASFGSERGTGYSDTHASTSAAAELRLGGSMSVISDRGWFGSTIYQPIPVAGQVGHLAPAGSNAGSRMNRGTSRWLGLADSSKSAFEFVPDGDKPYAEALRAGRDLNSAFVAKLVAKAQ